MFSHLVKKYLGVAVPKEKKLYFCWFSEELALQTILFSFFVKKYF